MPQLIAADGTRQVMPVVSMAGHVSMSVPMVQQLHAVSIKITFLLLLYWIYIKDVYTIIKILFKSLWYYIL